jgi:hypothetical protein
VSQGKKYLCICKTKYLLTETREVSKDEGNKEDKDPLHSQTLSAAFGEGHDKPP